MQQRLHVESLVSLPPSPEMLGMFTSWPLSFPCKGANEVPSKGYWDT